jgi:bifunctional UDP-N-acetylglucosamine pyrophosphorylase/glucosamine-1-phosphate N-acetyltransferase
MADKIGMAILAAGEGKRMGKPIPKPLVSLLGKSLASYVLDVTRSFANENFNSHKIGMVVGHQKELVIDSFKSDDIDFPVQEKQLGTADALRSYFSSCSWASEMDYTLVVCGDTPLIETKDLDMLWNTIKVGKLDGAVASFSTDKPFGYGRVITGSKGGLKIVEERDATDEQRLVKNVNSGLYLLKTDFLIKRLSLISNDNKSGEFYLTDVFSEDENVGEMLFDCGDSFMGVNDLIQLNTARSHMQNRINTKYLKNGVHILDPSSTWIDSDCSIGKGSVIYPGTHISKRSVIGENCEIGVGSIIKATTIDNDVLVKPYSHFEGAVLKGKAVVGPYTRLREGAVIGAGSKIGNFVEIKKSELKEKVGVSHLSYIGDAEIGENVNIGCGFITCNYDGESKSKTIIGKNSFIGSDTQMIAPVEIGESSYIASGSTINKDVKSGSFAIARGRQENKLGMAKRFLKGKWSIKNK